MSDKDVRAREAIISSLKWALFLRVVAITILLGATAVLQARASSSLLTMSLVSIYLLAGITYLFTLLSAFLLRWVHRAEAFVYSQIIYEVMLITALISVTGRIFSFVYILSILSASILLRRRGAFVAALLSIAAYGGLLVAVNRWGERIFFVNSEFMVDVWGLGLPELIYTVAVNFAAFFMVAILASYLAEQLEQTGRQLREREEDLEELEARSENIIRSLNIGLVTLDQKGRITSFNRAAEEITGDREKNLIGKPIDDMFPGMDLDNCPREWIYENPEKGRLNLNLTATTLKGSRDQVIGRLLSFQDQTAFREMQELLKISDQLAAVGQLAAGLAHEIRNPLASISGSIQLLHQGGYEGDESRLMSIVLRETDRLNKLITEFLLFARPTVGPAQRINLKEKLSETVELFRQGCDPERIKTVLSCPDDLVVELDPNLLSQLLWNLYVNAAEAIEGRGVINVNVAVNDDGSSLGISVADTGPGIEPQMLNRIFTPFFTTKEFGTGLGLATAFRSAELLGGTMTVQSEPGKGAVLTVELPGSLRVG